MATRCQIQFKNGEDKAQLYQHWDGYPHSPVGVIKNLVEFKKWLDNNKVWGKRFDAFYLGANYIYFRKKQIAEDSKRLGKEYEDEAVLGYGIEIPDTFHGDEEFFYIISPKRQKNKQENKWEVKRWNIKVYFLSFLNRERKLLFSGSLEQAEKKFVNMESDKLYSLIEEKRGDKK